MFFNMILCELCGEKITILDRMRFGSKCLSCVEEERKKREEEKKLKEEKEKMVFHNIQKAKNILSRIGIHKANQKGYIDVFLRYPYAYILPENLVDEYIMNNRHFEFKADYNSLVEAVVKDNSEVERIAKEYYDLIAVGLENVAVELEKEKIAVRQRNFKIKQKAEKEYYGKYKTKRQRLDENLTESIFAKYNHECVICGAKEGLHIHHKDKNPSNNKVDNLIILCAVCHKKIHMNVR